MVAEKPGTFAQRTDGPAFLLLRRWQEKRLAPQSGLARLDEALELL
jgi:hypothetical protein